MAMGFFSSEVVATYLHVPEKAYSKLNYTHQIGVKQSIVGTQKSKHSSERHSVLICKKYLWF